MQRAYIIKREFDQQQGRSLVMTNEEEDCVLIDCWTKGKPDYQDVWSKDYVDRFLVVLVEKV